MPRLAVTGLVIVCIMVRVDVMGCLERGYDLEMRCIIWNERVVLAQSCSGRTRGLYECSSVQRLGLSQSEPNIAHALRRGTLTMQRAALPPSSCLRPGPCVGGRTKSQAKALLCSLQCRVERPLSTAAGV